MTYNGLNPFQFYKILVKPVTECACCIHGERKSKVYGSSFSKRYLNIALTIATRAFLFRRIPQLIACTGCKCKESRSHKAGQF